MLVVTSYGVLNAMFYMTVKNNFRKQKFPIRKRVGIIFL